MVIHISAQSRINKKCITCSKVKLLKEFTLLKKYRASYCKDCNKLILIKSPKIIKKCTECKKNKSLDKFSGSNGLKAFKVGLCIECRKITQSQWKKNNRDKVNQYHKQWKLENPEKYRKQRDRYRKKNAKQIKEYYLKNKNIILKRTKSKYKNLTNKQKRERYKKRKIWISKNREKYLASKRKYNLKNAAKIKSYWTKNKKRLNKLALKRYQINKKDSDFKKRRLKSVMKWKKKNPDKVNASARLYYARNRGKLAIKKVFSDNNLKKKKALW